MRAAAVRTIMRSMNAVPINAVPMNARRAVAVLALVVLASAVLSGCGIGWNDQQISTVEVAEDDTTLWVGYHCDVDASVVAEEHPDEVRLTFRVYGHTGNDCADSVEVRLDRPLADRRLVDASNDAAITPCRPAPTTTGVPC
jgi:hypothetical protein